MSDDHARQWYFGPGGDTDSCSGTIDDYTGHMTQPAALAQIAAEEGLFRAPEGQYGLGPRPQRTRP
jgi:hypothetical protein